MRHHTSPKSSAAILVSLAFCLAPSVTAAAAEADLAQDVLNATGVRGGLIVHVGCGDGKLTAALRAGESYLVHGLADELADVAEACEHVRSLGLCGKVLVEESHGNRLPYVDNLVNLLVCGRPLEFPMDEVMRVLAPGGVAYVRQDGRWTKRVKPRPAEIDQWTHFLHDATGNAVAQDRRVGPPRHMQWTAEPVWARNHHKLASISAVVATEQRVFYIVDEGPAGSVAMPARWFVVGRDAFNGTLLWKRSIPSWVWHMQGFRSGPVQLPRTLVADGDRVYVPLGLGAPVTALDAATGQIVRTYADTRSTEEIIFSDGVLLAVTGSPTVEQAGIGPQRPPRGRFPNEKSIVAIRAETGQTLWTRSESPSARLMPLTLAAAGRQVFFVEGGGVVCLDRDAGNESWRQPTSGAAETDEEKKPADGTKPRKQQKSRQQRGVGWSVATLVVQDGVVLWADGRQLAALSATSGEALWECPCKVGFRSPVDVFVAAGLVWLGPDFAVGRDLHTGQIKQNNVAAGDVWTIGHHHRCYREKATERYILTGKRGIEFLDLAGDTHTRNNWIRGTCQYGIMPCNGLIYAPSHACGCFMEAKLYGFWALAPQRETKASRPESKPAGQRPRRSRLERGPAYSRDAVERASAETQSDDDWPTHRHDPLRSGSTTMELPAELQETWQATVGGRISAPVVAGGSVVLADIDAHRLVALDARSGKMKWEFTAAGRVDSPPTVHGGLVLFGCVDGRVYCLRLDDGQLVWRFDAAPANLKTVALDQVESVWPVHGSVLLQDGVAYVAAGRSSYLDGGIFLYGLNPATGQLVCRTRIRTEHPQAAKEKNDSQIEVNKFSQNATDFKTFTSPDRSDAFSMAGATNDVLVGDGTSVYLRHLRFDRQGVRQPSFGRHLLSTSSLLDDVEDHRSHWVLGTGDFSRTAVAYSWIAYGPGRFGSALSVPYGLMLSFDQQTVWGVRRGNSGGYTLFAEGNRPFAADEPHLPDFRKPQGEKHATWKWSTPLPMRPRALLRAGKSLLLGGMPATTDQLDRADVFEGRQGGTLWTVSTADGSKTAEYQLKTPPVWDGMAAAGGRLYVSTANGQVLCLDGR